MIGQCPQKQKIERNRQVVEKRRAGATLKAIGQEFGICAETVRQIIWRWECMEKHGRLPEQANRDKSDNVDGFEEGQAWHGLTTANGSRRGLGGTKSGGGKERPDGTTTGTCGTEATG